MIRNTDISVKQMYYPAGDEWKTPYSRIRVWRYGKFVLEANIEPELVYGMSFDGAVLQHAYRTTDLDKVYEFLHTLAKKAFVYRTEVAECLRVLPQPIAEEFAEYL